MSPVPRRRIRTIKPEIYHDERLSKCCREARYTFIGLITMADDAGRIRFTPQSVVGHVFPFDSDVTLTRMNRWIRELEGHRLVQTYQWDGGDYLWITGWQRNQKINRPSVSVLPCPPNPAGTWWPHDGNAPPDSVNGGVQES